MTAASPYPPAPPATRFARTRVFLRTAAALWLVESMRAIARHKMRSALTALGILIGTAAVVCVASIGRASSVRAEQQLQNLGDNLVWIEAGSRNVNGVRTGSHGMNTLTLHDAQAILGEVPLIRSVSPQVDGPVQVVYGDRNWSTHYRGVSPDFVTIRRWDIAAGADFDDDDVAHAARVCVLGETVRAALFGDGDALGREIRIGRQFFRVVGVLAVKGQSASGSDQDDTVLLPYTTAQKKLRARNVTWLDDIMCSAVSRDAVDSARTRVQALLRQRHRIEPGVDDDFNIRRPDEVINAQIAASQTFARLLLVVASIALLVGGVGIMNMMLVSVSERTREIGLRLALGATSRAVQAQFLGEAAVLCLLAGLLGVGVGVLGSIGLAHWTEWPLSIPFEAFVIGPLFSVIVGIGFGFYPARRASQLDPIIALRTE